MLTQNSYENIQFTENTFPVIFHFDTLQKQANFMIHWQNDLELLFLVEGQANISSDTQQECFSPGDIAVINCTHLHSINAVGERCRYYCLIVSRDFLEHQGIPISNLSLQFRLQDQQIRSMFQRICQEMEERDEGYKAAVKSTILLMVVELYRRFSLQTELTPLQDRRLKMVKTAVRYIQQHFTEPLTVDSISAAAGFSKYYFCRGFKEVTGRTVIDYLNFIRCTHARSLLSSGRCNVGESAELSGFQNVSYFTKTYKRYFHCLPSQQQLEQDSEFPLEELKKASYFTVKHK